MRVLLNDILSSTVVALADTPWSYLTTEILAAAKAQNIPLSFLWTRREPLDWAEKRVTNHGESYNFQCSVVNEFHLLTAFDVSLCLSVAKPDRILYAKDLLVAVSKDMDVYHLAAEYVVHERFLESILPSDRTRHICFWDTVDNGLGG